MSTIQNNNSLYLYCIIPKADGIELNQAGMNNEKLYAFEYKDFLAVVSHTPYKVYDLSEENIFTHEGIIRKIMQEHDVLPFNFGNVLKSEKELIKFLDSTYDHIKRVFKKTSGRIELGLKVFIKSEKLNEEIENNEIRRLKKQIESINETKAYLLKSELGRLVHDALEEKKKEYEDKIFKYLKQYCADAKINNCSTVRMILNAAFLIDKDKQEIFDEQVNIVIDKYKEILDFKYSGPWPPYNFVTMPK